MPHYRFDYAGIRGTVQVSDAVVSPERLTEVTTGTEPVTEKMAIAHIVWSVIVNGLGLSEIDGWADFPDSDCVVTWYGSRLGVVNVERFDA